MAARPSQERILQLVLAAGAAFSLGGVAYAVWFGQAADGARGGAIAVAISFAALFAARSTPQDVVGVRGHRRLLARCSLKVVTCHLEDWLDRPLAEIGADRLAACPRSAP